MRSPGPSLVVGALAAGLGLAACDADQTAILLGFSSGLQVDTEITSVLLHAETPSGAVAEERFEFYDEVAGSVALRPKTEGSSERVSVIATALYGDAPVMRRRLELAFVPDHILRVSLVLHHRCAGVVCAETEDCNAAGLCTSPFAGDAGTDGGTDGGDDAADGGVDGPDADPPDATTPTVCGDAGASCARNVLLSEVAVAGETATDEFVELHNPTDAAVALEGVVVEHCATLASCVSLATLPAGAELPAHGYYLVGAVGYTASGADADHVALDWTSGRDLSPGGGAVTLFTVAGGAVLDRLGWGSVTAYEGVAAPGGCGGSYERKARSTSDALSMGAGGEDLACGNGYDRDMNADDFVCRTAPEAQGTASAGESLACE